MVSGLLPIESSVDDHTVSAVDTCVVVVHVPRSLLAGAECTHPLVALRVEEEQRPRVWVGGRVRRLTSPASPAPVHGHVAVVPQDHGAVSAPPGGLLPVGFDYRPSHHARVQLANVVIILGYRRIACDGASSE